jgi:MSHA biogenesis protein MshN
MSVINQVLKDLDRQGANARMPSGVIAVNQTPVAAPRWIAWLAGCLAIALTAWWFWPAAPVAGPAASASVPLAPGAPRLRLSQNLGEAGRHADEADDHPARGITSKAVSLRAPVEALGASALHADRPGLLSRMDTQLSELRHRPAMSPEPTRPPAETSARVVKENKPPTPEVLADEAWRQAARLLEQGRNHDARERLDNVLRLDPKHAAARQSLAALVLEAGDRARAETLLREGQALHPNDVWYPRSLAQLHLQNADFSQAAGILKATLSRHTDAANWALYAGTLGKLGKQEESAQAYREALRLEPGQGNWWIGMAVALEQSANKAEAGMAYQRALQTRLGAEMREFAQQKTRELGGH